MIAKVEFDSKEVTELCQQAQKLIAELQTVVLQMHCCTLDIKVEETASRD